MINICYVPFLVLFLTIFVLITQVCLLPLFFFIDSKYSKETVVEGNWFSIYKERGGATGRQ